MNYAKAIEKAGFRLHLHGGKLLVEPFSRLTDKQRDFIRRHRDQIIAELSGQDDEVLRALQGQDDVSRQGVPARPSGDARAEAPAPSEQTAGEACGDDWENPCTLDEALRQACEDLTVTPDQARAAMSDADLDDWRAGRITQAELRDFVRAMGRRLHQKPGPAPEVDDPLTVPCHTLGGGVVLIQAEDEQHAARLRRWNPAPFETVTESEEDAE